MNDIMSEKTNGESSNTDGDGDDDDDKDINGSWKLF